MRGVPALIIIISIIIIIIRVSPKSSNVTKNSLQDSRFTFSRKSYFYIIA